MISIKSYPINILGNNQLHKTHRGYFQITNIFPTNRKVIDIQ